MQSAGDHAKRRQALRRERLPTGSPVRLAVRSPAAIGGFLVSIIATTALAPGDRASDVDFGRDVRPIFNRHCIACHGGVKQSSGLSFVYRNRVLATGRAGKPIVRPGDPSGSFLLERVTAGDDDRMPPADHGPRLGEEDVATLRRWIAAGAPWNEHWAFVPPVRHAIPEVSDPAWCRETLDAFVLHRLDREGLRPGAGADRVEWLRRVSLDLIGLPPSLDEVEDFLADRSPDAHARVVDRLLASPHFGERWAAVWLDLARYADSQGYEKDNLRTMWPYRDWVIRAFNADMPFDDFTVRQLAGDLLPDATLDDIIATAFHRNTPTNAEGGTDDEEFRVTAVIDRVGTTWEAWQGVTFKCIQCHAHPYLPVPHEDYYRFMAFLNTTADWDLSDDAPRLAVPWDLSLFGRAREIDRELARLRRDEVAGTARRAEETKWSPLSPVRAESTGQTQLVPRTNDQGAVEIWTEGTVSHDSRFTLELAPPPDVRRITALRIDVLPRDPRRAPHSPELGFVLSEVKAELLVDDPTVTASGGTGSDADGEKPVPLSFAAALGDESEPFSDATATLEPHTAGWGAKPRITHPRRLVLVLARPVAVDAGHRLRLTIRQEDAPNDMMPLVMGRSRYSVTSDERWTALLRDPEFTERRGAIARLVAERRAMGGPLLPVVAEQEPSLRRRTTVFVRGNWLDKGAPVEPGLPGLFGDAPPGDAPPGDGPPRLAMARWLASSDNILTARVAVNRIWNQLFGTGLVETLEDFGPSGQRPSHPEVLDFLALRFGDDLDWSVKRLLRELVLSATYRQSARVPAELADRDPDNRLLARGPRKRLSAEMIRDNALAVSGLLTRRIGGPPAMPPQPEGLGRAARSSVEWKTSTGTERYRRGVYTLWRRSNVYPSMATFDAPSRLVCTARRVTTNTPLQALAALNDPVQIECAVALAGRMLAASDSDRERIVHGHRLATGRAPSRADLRSLLALHAAALEAYRADPALSEQLAGDPGKSALALVANAILNLDAVITR